MCNNVVYDDIMVNCNVIKLKTSSCILYAIIYLLCLVMALPMLYNNDVLIFRVIIMIRVGHPFESWASI